MFRSFVAAALILVLPLLSGCFGPLALRAEAPVYARSYVALGASDSVGVGTNDPERESWVSVFYSHLPAGSRLTNLAVSGSTVGRALDQQLPVAVAARPDLVTVWLAVNDFNARIPLETYSRQLDELIRELRATGATILVGNLPDVSGLAPARGRDAEAIKQAVPLWNAEIESVADRHGAIVVDIHGNWSALAQRPDFLAADGFHPSTLGHRAIGELFYESLILAESR